MPKYVIWCIGEPPCPGGQGSLPTKGGFLSALRGKNPPRPVVVDHPEDGLPLGDVKAAQAMLDLIGQGHARILAVLN